VCDSSRCPQVRRLSQANSTVVQVDDDAFVEAEIQVDIQQHQQPVCQVMMTKMTERCEIIVDVLGVALWTALIVNKTHKQHAANIDKSFNYFSDLLLLPCNILLLICICCITLDYANDANANCYNQPVYIINLVFFFSAICYRLFFYSGEKRLGLSYYNKTQAEHVPAVGKV